MKKYSFIIIGGGAAGFFAAITAKQENPELSVLLLEKTGSLLSKVRISGGGRCNVTHSCFDPKLLVTNYPRGNKELIGPFMRFQPRDTIHWFESRNVPLKVEDDGRIFPISDSSSSIIDCLMSEAQKLGVEIRTKQSVKEITKNEYEFSVILDSSEMIQCSHLLLATGSHPQGHSWAKSFGHTIQEPVPSLFAVNIKDFPLKESAGVSFEKVSISAEGFNRQQIGPLLITHWGFSGPAALKLSSWAARYFFEKKYQATLVVDWLPEISSHQILEDLKNLRKQFNAQAIGNNPIHHLPKNFWKKILELLSIDAKKRLGDISNENFMGIAKKLKEDNYPMIGKTTHKEEFVTCGGVTLSEINFKTMESRLCPGLFFAGEILDIDAVTGGFNFQNAWTTGWIVGHSIN